MQPWQMVDRRAAVKTALCSTVVNAMHERSLRITTYVLCLQTTFSGVCVCGSRSAQHSWLFRRARAAGASFRTRVSRGQLLQ